MSREVSVMAHSVQVCMRLPLELVGVRVAACGKLWVPRAPRLLVGLVRVAARGKLWVPRAPHLLVGLVRVAAHGSSGCRVRCLPALLEPVRACVRGRL